MQIKRKIKLKGFLDPLTLLKFSQVYREIQAGDQLEILFEGVSFPEELFKVVPTGGFEVISKQTLQKEALYRIVLEKKAVKNVATTGGCPCL